MSATISKKDLSRILSDVPKENAFYFYITEGVETKISAISLEDFANKLKDIDESSILFHYPRNDFQAWIRFTLKDNKLADEMCFIQRDISGEKLRQELVKMVQKRISEIKEEFPSSQCNPGGLCLS
jgi:hypothetical protein